MTTDEHARKYGRLSHADTGDSRYAIIPGTSYIGSEGRTMCGRWLPMWEDGPDGALNAALWGYDDPTCPACRKALEDDE